MQTEQSNSILNLDLYVIYNLFGSNFSKMYLSFFNSVQDILEKEEEPQSVIYTDEEKSIYKSVVERFLRENPEFMQNEER